MKKRLTTIEEVEAKLSIVVVQFMADLALELHKKCKTIFEHNQVTHEVRQTVKELFGEEVLKNAKTGKTD